MKLDKFFKLVVPIMMVALTACGNSSVTGYYGFTMGKEGSTRIGVTMQLSDKEYVPSNKNNASSTIESSAEVTSTSQSSSTSVDEIYGKVFNMTVINENAKSSSSSSVLTSIDPDTLIADSSSPTTSSSSESSKDFSNMTMSGAYLIEKEIDSTKTEVDRLVLQPTNIIGVEIDDETAILIKQSIKYIVLATIGDGVISLTLPVSINDLIKQLNWFSNHTFQDPLPGIGSEEHWWTVTISLARQ